MSNDKEQTLIVLIGPMGAGKTTIGRLLAQRLNYDFYDSDAVIEDSTGASVSWIFDKEGEIGFRQRETKVIDELTQKKQAVIATGGGAILAKENQQYLQRGFIIYLQASVDVQYERTYRDRHRPLLQTANPKEKLKALFDIRHPIYTQLADLIIVTGYLSPKKMLQEILKQLPPQSP